MLFRSLDDGSAQVEVAVFNELYEQHRNRLKEDRLVIIHGKVSNDDYSGGLRVSAEEIYDLQLAREARARALRITLNGNADVQRLRQVLDPFRACEPQQAAGVRVEVCLERNDYQCVLRLGEDWRVRMADDMFEKLHGWVSADSVEIAYQ